MPDNTEPVPDRMRGTLWGLAIGDALGAPLEGMKEGHIRQLFGMVHDYVDLSQALPDKPWRWRRPGLHTDDTQQALLLVEAFFTGGAGVSPKSDRVDSSEEGDSGGDGSESSRLPRPHPIVTRLARLYLALASPPGVSFDLPTGAHRGTGSNFRAVLTGLGSRVIRNDDPTVWRFNQPSAGTGAAMRIGPLGAWTGARTEEDLVRLAIEVSLLTHSDPRGISAAVAIAFGVRRLAGHPNGARLDVREFVVDLAEAVHCAEERMIGEYGAFLDPARSRERDFDLSDSLGVVASLVEENNDDLARRTLVTQARGYAPLQGVSQPNHGFAPAAVPMVFYRALSAVNFVLGLEATINDGGDADTMGAMVGALLGARFGFEAVVPEWREELVAREIVGQRAEALARGYRGRPWDDLLGAEAEWSRDEAAARRSLVEAQERDRERKDRREPSKKGRGNGAKKGRDPAVQAGREPAAPWLPGGQPSVSRSLGRGSGSRPRPTPPTPPGPSIQERIKDLPFAPPPEIWLRGKSNSRTPEHTTDVSFDSPSSEEKKREKTARGRKRIGWKEDRRRKKRNGAEE